MEKIVSWVKENKLSTVLLLIIGYFLYQNWFGRISPFSAPKIANYDLGRGGPIQMEKTMMLESAVGSLPPAGGRAAPMPEIENRLVVEESNVSMVVDEVREKVDQVLNKVKSIDGYMVSSSINQPQESPFASLTVRVPVEDLRPMLEFLRGLAIKVTSENLTGRDVTDQYVDIEERLITLKKTKTKFEEIMDKAVKIDDILRVQRELINLQDQIDRLKGRQEYLEKTAQNAKLTVYLSTDEWSLPYAPDEQFRPKVIFKQAVRALVRTGRAWAGRAIWIGVYSIIWLPIVLVIVFWKKRKKRISS